MSFVNHHEIKFENYSICLEGTWFIPSVCPVCLYNHLLGRYCVKSNQHLSLLPLERGVHASALLDLLKEASRNSSLNPTHPVSAGGRLLCVFLLSVAIWVVSPSLPYMLFYHLFLGSLSKRGSVSHWHHVSEAELMLPWPPLHWQQQFPPGFYPL